MDVKSIIKSWFSQCDFSGKYAANDIAQHLIYTCTKEEISISNLKLQKILYFLQATFLQKEDYALFSDDIEAWQFGPVVRAVYGTYCGYGAVDIYEFNAPNITFTDKETKIINKVLHDKIRYDVWELVAQTHEAGGPWDLTYKKGAGDKRVIPKEVILEYA